MPASRVHPCLAQLTPKPKPEPHLLAPTHTPREGERSLLDQRLLRPSVPERSTPWEPLLFHL